jgi:hypothetical protein
LHPALDRRDRRQVRRQEQSGNATGWKRLQIDLLTAESLPLFVGRIKGRVRKGESSPSKDRVEPIEVGLDVLGARLVAAAAVAQIQLVGPAEQFIDTPGGVIRLFDGPDALDTVVERG